MRALLTYYGGKQRLAPVIVPLIPPHVLYAEPFAGGAAVFFAKQPAAVEVLNDLNGELINFYKVVKEKFSELEKEMQSSLHSRRQHQHAWVIYNFPELFSDISRAWATWLLSLQSFSSRLDGSWGYDLTDDTTTMKFFGHRPEFLLQYAKRLEHVQLENSDAIYIIKSRDSKDAFFYCDPPYLIPIWDIIEAMVNTIFPSCLKSFQTYKENFYCLLIRRQCSVNMWSGLTGRKNFFSKWYR